MAREIRARETTITFPSRRFECEPGDAGGFVKFCRLVLGVEPGELQVRLFVLAFFSKYAAASTGRKIGKSWFDAAYALYVYCTRSRGHVFFTSTTFRQIDEILW